MNQYLLLRDNKQTGPYSAADLRNLGLKPYDLVWQEGKSAAWRYPGEIDELIQFAPPVEEQPFDRFYKKPDQQKNQNDDFSTPVQKAKSVQLPTASGKIVVTLPAGVEKKNVEVRSGLSDRNDMYSASGSVPSKAETNTVKPVLNDHPVRTDSTKFQPDLYSSTKSNSGDELLTGRAVNSNFNNKDRAVSKRSWQIMAAASIILAMVVSGLYFSQRSENRNLQQFTESVPSQEADLFAGNESVPAEHINNSTPEPEPVLPESNTAENFFLQDDQPLPVSEKPGLQKEKEQQASPADPVNKPVAEKVKESVKEEDIAQGNIPVREAVIRQEDAVKNAVKSGESNSVVQKNLMKLVNVNSNDFKVGAFGGISQMKLTLSNKSLHQLSKVEVEIQYLNQQKNVVKTQNVFFEQVGPGEQLTLDVPKSPRGVDVKYSVKNIVPTEPGLVKSSE